MVKKVMVCGVDCHAGDANCNGYCEGKVDDPPPATAAQQIAAAREAAHRALDAAERAWFEFAGLIDPGIDRVAAFDVYDRVRKARAR